MQFTEKRLRVKWYGRLDVAWLAMCVLVQTAWYAPWVAGRWAFRWQPLHVVPGYTAGSNATFKRRNATPGLPGDSNRRRMLEGPEKIHTRHLLSFCYKGSRYE